MYVHVRALCCILCACMYMYVDTTRHITPDSVDVLRAQHNDTALLDRLLLAMNMRGVRATNAAERNLRGVRARGAGARGGRSLTAALPSSFHAFFALQMPLPLTAAEP